MRDCVNHETSFADNHGTAFIPAIMGLGQQIALARKGAKLSQVALGKKLHVGQSTVAQWETDKNEPSLQKIEEIAKVTSKPMSWFVGDAKSQRDNAPVDNTREMVASRNQGRVSLESEGAQSFLEYPQDLKILGHVKAGVEGFFLDQGEAQGMAPRPPSLRGVKAAFAVRVRDTSMFPAFEPDDLVFVNPSLPIIPNVNVIIELTDGQAFIKRLIRRTEKAVICKQWQPEEEIRYDPKMIKAIYRIVRPT